ncbi:MFS transporter [Acidilobus sp. 7A]|uniref:MFS transporter n=1 Tax=Acidilobus sp. 7A TaxID=1577685 RepID=UPI000764EFEF|nr:MFS transporter [Acidilobus sp. 7A]AMD30196.1 MFS transporter [Acidilobus sp. 7A]
MEYKWTVLTNTTLGILMAMINSSVLIISLPAIFRGIQINPLAPSSFDYLLWLLMGYGVVSSSLVVSFGKLSDMYGRVRLYRLGFMIFTLGSVLLSITPGKGSVAATELVAFRMVQAVGAALLMANSAALITDAFPITERGRALGINQVAGMVGNLVGLILGGVLATVNWRLVFIISVPFGVAGTAWSYLKLRELSRPRREEKVDIPGNLAFIGGLVLLLAGITYALEPYHGEAMGWTSPRVIALMSAGAAVLAVFPLVELRVQYPMFRLELFRSRQFSAGIFAALLAGLALGGLMITLTVMLQGIWLPLHGYSYSSTPFWAGIYMLPMLFGFVALGPLSGALSDKYGARELATGGMLIAFAAMMAMMTLSYNFSYLPFALMIFIVGVGNGMFVAPNTASIMNAVPPEHRGVASGMRSVMTSMANTVSIALYFSLLLSAFEAKLPSAIYSSLVSAGFPQALALEVSKIPPTAALFAAFLGYNPMQVVLQDLPQSMVSRIEASDPSGISDVLSNTWFPHVIAPPFMYALRFTLLISGVIVVVAAVASALRGKMATQSLGVK